mgnify:CR=1 FL=1
MQQSWTTLFKLIQVNWSNNLSRKCVKLHQINQLQVYKNNYKIYMYNKLTNSQQLYRANMAGQNKVRQK